MKPTLLSKIDSVLEYCQTSSSDLTGGEDDVQIARDTIIEVEKEVKELINVTKKSLDTLTCGVDAKIDYKKWEKDLKVIIKKVEGE